MFYLIIKLSLLLSFLVLIQSKVLTYGDGKVHADFEVHCDDTAMYVFFNKTQLDQRTNGVTNNRNYSIKWDGQDSNPACKISLDSSSNIGNINSMSSFSNTIWIKAALPSSCGLIELYDNKHIIYNHTVIVTYGENPRHDIIREEHDLYHVMCLKNRTSRTKVDGDYFNVTYNLVPQEEKNATSEFSLNLGHTDTNDAAQTEYELGSFIKFTLSINTVVNTVKAVIQECWSTSDGSNNRYALINNRCPVDAGTSYISQNASLSIFKTEVFKYLGYTNTSVYVECLVRICLESDGTNQCTFCSNATRKRRDINDGIGESSTPAQMAVLKSPLFYIIEKDGISPPSPPSPKPPQQEQQKQSNSFITTTPGIVIIVLAITLAFFIILAAIKVFLFPSAASWTINPKSTEVNHGRLEY